MIDFTRKFKVVLISPIVLFVICACLGAAFGYGTGLDPYSPEDWMVLNPADFKNTHPLRSAYNSLMVAGTFGSALLTPIFLILLTAVEKGKSLSLLVKIQLTILSILIWAGFVGMVFFMRFAILQLSSRPAKRSLTFNS